MENIIIIIDFHINFENCDKLWGFHSSPFFPLLNQVHNLSIRILRFMREYFIFLAIWKIFLILFSFLFSSIEKFRRKKGPLSTTNPPTNRLCASIGLRTWNWFKRRLSTIEFQFGIRRWYATTRSTCIK